MQALLTAQEVADVLRVSLRRFEQIVAIGDAPPHCRIGRLRRWRPEDVNAWLTDRLSDGAAHPLDEEGKED